MKLSLKLLIICPVLLMFSSATIARENAHSSDLISKDIKSEETEKKNVISENRSQIASLEFKTKSLTCEKTNNHSPSKISLVDINSKQKFENRPIVPELRHSLEEPRPKKFNYGNKYQPPIKDDRSDSIVPIVLGTAAVIATGSLIYYYGTYPQLFDNNFSGSSGYRHPRGWLDSNDMERYCDYLENHFKKPEHGGFKAYVTSANGHGLGQDRLTALLKDDIENHWQNGTTTPSLFIEGDLESTKIHYFPVNLDVTSGGIHWTGIVVDTESSTIEYYDSFGDEAPTAIKDRMKMIKRSFETFTGAEYEIVTIAVAHQTDGYNCGVYALHYAELRAQGFSSAEIQGMKINIKYIRAKQKSKCELISQNFPTTQ